eukprot:GCRY01000582.1.p1 GENE.GCRY01000582.1~~GCRY01000582.1.p1  ORF type:complete len:272 (-),score=35.37 GCRY01000582.1:123-938(-)
MKAKTYLHCMLYTLLISAVICKEVTVFIPKLKDFSRGLFSKEHPELRPTNKEALEAEDATAARDQFEKYMFLYPTENGVGDFISSYGLSLHIRHLEAYRRKLNELLGEYPFLHNRMLFEIILQSDFERKSKPQYSLLFNNAAQLWSHSFFFSCITPTPHFASPSSRLLESIKQSFGSMEKMQADFKQTALSLFGSGWVCLAEDLHTGKLAILALPNAEVSFTQHYHPLLLLDVWEHSYYPTFENYRAKYVDKFFEYINWEVPNSMIEVELI